jgi:hypothetical protein
MKYVCMLLIAVLVVHLQCGGSCLAEMLSSQADVSKGSAEPPCHQHQQQSSDVPQPRHDTVSSCSQGPIIDAKATASGKCALDVAAISPIVSRPPSFTAPVGPQPVVNNPPGIPDPTFATSVLRI